MTGQGPKCSDVCEVLDWDTAFWGFRIARVYGGRLDQDRIVDVDAWCRRHQIQCLYFLARADDADSTIVVEDGGFRLVDVRLEFCHPAREPICEHAAGRSGNNLVVVREARPEDCGVLQGIARESYHDTRFYFDRRFPRPLCDLLYDTWIRRSCDGYADSVLVADMNGEPVGYITCHLDAEGQDGKIGLVGVSAHSQGQGIGRMLVSRAIDWFHFKGVLKVFVVTQGRNLMAQRLYQRCGFVTHKLQLWYHKWYLTPESADV